MELAIALLLAACSGGGGGVPETETACTDAVDEDEDGATDCLDADCADDPACQSFAEVCEGGVDEDLDGLIDCEDDDCFGDPACWQVDDPTDLPEPLGDPSVDIDKIRATLAAGTATFFATFDAPWPPPTSAYSWFVYFEIDNDGNTPVAGVTIQRHDGVDSTMATGIPAANITVRQTARGVWVRMIGVPVAGEKYYIESGIQESNPGTRVTDTVVSAPAPLP
jgi:hypothetical protein